MAQAARNIDTKRFVDINKAPVPIVLSRQKQVAVTNLIQQNQIILKRNLGLFSSFMGSFTGVMGGLKRFLSGFMRGGGGSGSGRLIQFPTPTGVGGGGGGGGGGSGGTSLSMPGIPYQGKYAGHWGGNVLAEYTVKTLNALIFSKIAEADKLQIKSLALGTDITKLARSAGGTLDDLKTSWSKALELKLQLVSVGLKINNKGLMELGTRMSNTGQSTEGLIDLMANTFIATGMTNRGLTDLSKIIENSSIEHKTSVSKLVESINKFSSILEPASILGSGEEMTKALASVAAKTGVDQDGLARALSVALSPDNLKGIFMAGAGQELANITGKSTSKAIEKSIFSLISKLATKQTDITRMVPETSEFRYMLLQQYTKAMGLEGMGNLIKLQRSIELERQTMGDVETNREHQMSMRTTMDRMTNIIEKMSLGSYGLVNDTTRRNMSTIQNGATPMSDLSSKQDITNRLLEELLNNSNAQKKNYDVPTKKD